MKRTHYCGSVDTMAHVGQTVTLMGWAATRRDLGGVVFIDLRDREGICQVVARPEDFEGGSRGGRQGARRVRPRGHRSGRCARRRTPINSQDQDRQHRNHRDRDRDPLRSEDASVRDRRREQHRRRHPAEVPLPRHAARPPIQKALMLRHKLALAIRTYLDEHGFLEIETPDPDRFDARRRARLSRSVPRPPWLVLSHSPSRPQMFKQLCMVGGLDRYFQIARCFRDEDLRADRQPEFTQVDIEMSFPHEEAIFELIEPLYQKVLER